jgi:beta-aspartyl-peptidase (threonine type)
MKYKGLSVSEAAEVVVMHKLKKQGGTGGIIAVDSKGNVAMTFNTSGMFRGYIKAGGEQMVGIFGL